jgi:outer membrane protein assembly factor BamB
MPDDWSRRALLATVGTTALAGCLTGPPADGGGRTDTPTTPRAGGTPTAGGDPDTPSTPDQPPTPEPTATPEPPATVGSEWPLPDSGPGGSRFTAATGPTDRVAELWSASAGAGLSAPVVADGTVFVGTEDGVVHAFDAPTGDDRWRRSIGATAGAPRVVDRTVYVPGDGALVALDARDGTERWRVGTDPLGDVVAAEHGLYYVTDDPDIEAIDERPSVVGLDHGGDERWQTTIEDPWQATVLVSPDRIFVPTGSYDMRPWMLATDTGDVLNDRRPIRGADFPSARCYRDSRLFSVDGFFGNVRAIPPGDGPPGWSWGDGSPGQFAVAAGPDRLYVANSPYDDSGAGLFALSVADGTVQWEVSGLSGTTARPVATAETVLVDTGESFRSFAPSDGSELWSGPTDLVGDAFVVVDDLVVTTDGRTVRALRPP